MPNRYPKRSQHEHTKKPYRLRNWAEYESALRKHGDLTLWFSAEAIASVMADGAYDTERVYSTIAARTG